MDNYSTTPCLGLYWSFLELQKTCSETPNLLNYKSQAAKIEAERPFGMTPLPKKNGIGPKYADSVETNHVGMEPAKKNVLQLESFRAPWSFEVVVFGTK